MLKKLNVFVLFLLLTFVLVACTENNPNTNGGGQSLSMEQDASQLQQNMDHVPTMKRATITPMDAYDVYVENFPNTKVKKVQLKQISQTYVYEVEGFDDTKEHEVKINSQTGEITHKKSELDAGPHQEIPKDLLGNVTKLVDKALQEAGEQAVLDSWEVEDEHGTIVLDIEIDLPTGQDLDYKYNLATEELIKQGS